MNVYVFIAAILFEIALGSFVIWGMLYRDKFDALIDGVEANIKKAARAIKVGITSVKVRIAKRWLRQAEIDVVSDEEKKLIAIQFLTDRHLIVQPIQGGKTE